MNIRTAFWERSQAHFVRNRGAGTSSLGGNTERLADGSRQERQRETARTSETVRGTLGAGERRTGEKGPLFGESRLLSCFLQPLDPLLQAETTRSRLEKKCHGQGNYMAAEAAAIGAPLTRCAANCRPANFSGSTTRPSRAAGWLARQGVVVFPGERAGFFCACLAVGTLWAYPSVSWEERAYLEPRTRAEDYILS